MGLAGHVRTMFTGLLYEVRDRKEEAFDVTVHLECGAAITFRCMGGPQVKTGGKWRLDLARPLAPLPADLVGLKQIKALCDSLTDELAAVLQCRVTKVQLERLDLE